MITNFFSRKRSLDQHTNSSEGAGHLVIADDGEGRTQMVCWLRANPENVLTVDEDGLVRIVGWSASSKDVAHCIRLERDGMQRFAPPMRQVLGFNASGNLDATKVFEQKSCYEISVFLHLPEGEVDRSYSIFVTDGQAECNLGTFRLRRAPSSPPKTRQKRARYKEVWNSVSPDLDNAKTAVAGYTDEEEFERTAQATAMALRSTVGLRLTDVVLEIGAGVGRAASAVAPHCRKWIATDVSEQMLSFAKERNARFDNIDYVPLSGWDLEPIEDMSVDVVYSTVVFMHLDEWERYGYVLEAFRVLRPGGRMYVDNYNLLSQPGWDFFMGVVQDHHPLNRPPNVSRSSTPEELASYLQRAGFENVIAQGPQESLFCWAYGNKPI